MEHFTPFQLGDGSSPSEAFIPTLNGWQVSQFTGAATFGLPLDVPAGPAGIKPSLQLGYHSQATDGPPGERKRQQAGWAGQGWSLDTGAVALHKLATGDDRYYSLTLGGKTYNLSRAEGLRESPNYNDPTHWAWRTSDESFIKVRAVENGLSFEGPTPYESRGGFNQGGPDRRQQWQVWTKDGTRYDFAEDL